MKFKVHQDIYIGVLIIMFCAAFLLITANLPKGAAIFPALMLVILALLACWITWDGVKKTKASKNGTPIDNTITLSKLKIPAITYLYIIVYIALFSLTGYFISTTVFIIALMKHFHMTSWKKIILITAGFVFAIYALFVKQLNVPVLNFGYLEQVFVMLR